MSDNVSEEVLKKIKEDGGFDELRRQLIDHIKKDEGLRRFAEEGVLGSKTMASPAADNMHKKEALNSIRRELEAQVLQEALRIAWNILEDDSGAFPKAVMEKVHEALCAVYVERAQADRQLY